MEPMCLCVCLCVTEGGGGGGDRAFLEASIQQLLLRQLLMSEEQQLVGLPKDTLPANSQMEGFRVGGAQGLVFLPYCQENDLLGHRSRPFPSIMCSQLIFFILNIPRLSNSRRSYLCFHLLCSFNSLCKLFDSSEQLDS